MRKPGYTLVEAIVAVAVIALVVGTAMKIFSNASAQSGKLNEQQMTDLESQRLMTFLRNDCRSTKEIRAKGTLLEITRFGLDGDNNVRETAVSYSFAAGRIVRTELDQMKVFEFSRWQKKTPDNTVPDLECLFFLASPSTLCVNLSVKKTGKPIIDEQVVYEAVPE
jgi:type II secretory pathway component PulJ